VRAAGPFGDLRECLRLHLLRAAAALRSTAIRRIILSRHRAAPRPIPSVAAAALPCSALAAASRRAAWLPGECRRDLADSQYYGVFLFCFVCVCACARTDVCVCARVSLASLPFAVHLSIVTHLFQRLCFSSGLYARFSRAHTCSMHRRRRTLRSFPLSPTNRLAGPCHTPGRYVTRACTRHMVKTSLLSLPGPDERKHALTPAPHFQV
jgi:hypothetical protein